MKSKGCDFGFYNGIWYRICYGLTMEGKMNYSKQLYEFSKDCKCDHCNNRFKYSRGVPNRITVTTDEKSKFQEVTEIINKYTCNSDKKENVLYIRLFND